MSSSTAVRTSTSTQQRGLGGLPANQLRRSRGLPFYIVLLCGAKPSVTVSDPVPHEQEPSDQRPSKRLRTSVPAHTVTAPTDPPGSPGRQKEESSSACRVRQPTVEDIDGAADRSQNADAEPVDLPVTNLRANVLTRDKPKVANR